MSVVQLSTYGKLCIMDIKKKFGEKVKHLRTQKGWSQEKLALIAELDRTYIPSIEKGDRNVSITVIQKIADAFKIDIIELFK
jgi:transcriptional regulator with XRE-family HTH domain